MRNPTRLLALVLVIGAMFLASCGGDSSSDGAAKATTTAEQADPAGPTTTTEPALTGEITVSAAASLTEAYTEIGNDFEATHPGTKVTFNFDSSGTLSQQILDGAPVDVYASADVANMTKLTEKDLIDGVATVFARNQLIIVTKPGNPQGVKNLADLSDAGIISLCGLDVPCGKFAQQILDGAGVKIPEGSTTRGQNVKATLTAVTEGDAVAGIVYVTDAQAAGEKVDAVDIPGDQNATATYPAGALAASENVSLAKAFISYVRGDDGQAVLKEHGFLPPA